MQKYKTYYSELLLKTNEVFPDVLDQLEAEN